MPKPFSWSVEAANNDTADAGINLQEGQSPPSLNDAVRSVMAGVASMLADQSGELTCVGAAGGNIVLGTNQGLAAADLDRAFLVSFTPDAANNGPCTLNIDGTGAKPLRRANLTELGPGDLRPTVPITVRRRQGGDQYVVAAPTIVEAGQVGEFGAGSAVPPGWVICDGRLLSRTDYAALFAAIGTTFGNGDGTTTFAIPDRRGRAGFGADGMGGTVAGRLTTAGGLQGALGSVGGSETVTLTTAQLAAHNHPATAAENGAVAAGVTGGGGSHTHGVDAFPGQTGAAGAHNHTPTVQNSGPHTHIGSLTASSLHTHGYQTGQFKNITAGSGNEITGLWSGNTSVSSNGASIDESFETNNGGNHTHAVTLDEAPNHRHTIDTIGNHTHTTPAIPAHTHGITTEDRGGGQPHPNMPPGICMIYAIKT